MNYTIITANSAEELINLVNEKLKCGEGWETVGSHTVTQGNDRYYKEWSQTLISNYNLD
jgi:hypothetical protein